MPILGIYILFKDDNHTVKILQNEFNLGNFSFYKGRNVQSFLTFSAKIVTERTARDIRQSIETDQIPNAIIHVSVGRDGLASVLISNNDYPKQVAHNLLNKVMADFNDIYSSNTCRSMPEQSGEMTSLNDMLKKYQNPQEADPLMRLQKDLDETKKILSKTLENILERDENLNNLVERSAILSFEAKAFYKTAKKTNQCCTLF